MGNGAQHTAQGGAAAAWLQPCSLLTAFGGSSHPYHQTLASPDSSNAAAAVPLAVPPPAQGVWAGAVGRAP